MIIAIVGRSGSGKSSITRRLSDTGTYHVCEIGNYVKQVFEEENNSEKKEQEDFNKKETRLDFVNRMLLEKGKDFFIKLVMEDALRWENCIISGVRSVEEIRCLKNNSNNLLTIALNCDEEELRRRYIEREKDVLSKGEAIELYKRRKIMEEKMGILEANRECDLQINTKSMSINQSVEIIEQIVRMKND